MLLISPYRIQLVIFISSLVLPTKSKHFNELSNKRINFDKKKVTATVDGSYVKFDCQVLDNAANNVTWEKDKRVINASSSNRYIFSKATGDSPAGRTFIINDVDSTDEGVYRCTSLYYDTIFIREFTLHVTDAVKSFVIPFLVTAMVALIYSSLVCYCLRDRKDKTIRGLFSHKSPKDNTRVTYGILQEI